MILAVKRAAAARSKRSGIDSSPRLLWICTAGVNILPEVNRRQKQKEKRTPRVCVLEPRNQKTV